MTIRATFGTAILGAVIGWVTILEFAVLAGVLALLLFPVFVVLLVVAGVIATLLLTAASAAGLRLNRWAILIASAVPTICLFVAWPLYLVTSGSNGGSGPLF